VYGEVIIGPWWGFGYPYWPWPYPYYYPPPYYGYYPPPYYGADEPQEYIQQEREPMQGYWYYCPSSKAYFPTVRECPEEWVKVPPRPAGD
jgi:hypothetical protein